VPVRGRQQEQETLADLIDALARGHGSALLVEGHPGIGKSTLLAVAAEHASRIGIRTIAIAATPQGHDLPWALASQLVEALDGLHDGQLANVLRGPATRALDLLHAPHNGIGTPFPFVQGVACAVSDIAHATPLLVLVDDAHLADEPSAAMLATLLPRAGEAQLALVIARRPPAVSESVSLDTALSTHHVPRLWLDELDEQSIRSIVADRLGDSSPELHADIVRAVGGNPLLARESADLCARQPGGESSATALAHVLVGEAAIVRRSTLARLGAAGEHSLQVAAAISVLGADARVDRVAELCTLPTDVTLAAVEHLRRCDLIVIAGTRPAIRHPLIEEMILATAGDLRRSALHAAAATVLHTGGVDDVTVVGHLVAGLGATRVQPWMVPALRCVAARQLGLGSPRKAIELARAGLSLCANAPERTALALDLARAEAAAGYGDVTVRLDAIADELAAAGAAFGPVELVALAEVAEAQYATGQFALAERTCDRALGVLGLETATVRAAIESVAPQGPEASLPVARLIVGRDSAALLAGHGSRLDPTVDQLVAEHRHAPTLGIRLLAAMRAGERALGVDIGPQQLQLLIDTAGIDEALPDALVRPVYEPIGTAMAMAGQPAQAAALLTRLLDVAADRGDLVAHVSLLPIRAYARLRQGRLAEALADATGALELTQRAPAASRYAAAPAIYVAAIVELERDRIDAAARLVSLGDAAERWGESPLYGWYLCAVGRVALASDQPDAAARAFARAGTVLTASGGSGSVTPWRSGLALARHAIGESGTVGELIAAEQRAAAALGDVRLLAESHRVEAALHNDHHEAAEQLAATVERLAAVDDPLTWVHVQADRGRRLRQAGHTRAARRTLADAVEQARRIGAHRVERIATRELARAGARRAATAVTGINALTPAELRVARLAATGRRNAEIANGLFVSLKTVESQLSSAYRKLAISGRDELRSALGAELESPR